MGVISSQVAFGLRSTHLLLAFRVVAMRPPSCIDGEDVITIQDAHCPSRTFCVRARPSNIDRAVRFSILRCALSMVSIALALTDIPRTGLFINLFAYYPKLGPDTMMYYGPYAYPIVHLNGTVKGNGSFMSSLSGFSGESQLDEIDIWAYKFDSLSIPTRALAEQLNVSSYPPCLLYREHCPQPALSIATVFKMLDELMTKIERQYFAQEFLNHLPIVFETTNYWIDRLHHVMLGRLGYRVDVRVHSVYRYHAARSVLTDAPIGIDICEPTSAAESHYPLVCKPLVAWQCDDPFLGATKQVSVAESVRLRVIALQQQYPNADIELTLITTHSELQSHPDVLLPSVFYYSDSTEITTFIRGRECLFESQCVTVFLDDYRYERAVLQSSFQSLRLYTSLLRAVSQSHVWLRVSLLVFITCRARLSEARIRKKPLARKVGAVLLTLGKIPGHVLVYGSWLPIIGYSIAHTADCGLVHFMGENFWTTPNGFFSFDFMKYLVVASIQMRDIWLIALVWKGGMAIVNHFGTHGNERWRPEHGLLAFRGLFIGATSSLTIFAFLRAIHFRDCRVIGFQEIQRNRGAANAFLTQRLPKGAPDFGYTLDVKATVIASAVLVGLVLFVRAFFRMAVPRNAVTGSFLCRTFYVPLSTGVLFSASALNPFWCMELLQVQRTQGNQQGPTTTDVHKEYSPRTLGTVRPVGAGLRRRHCDTCDFISAPTHWRAVQGCHTHETLFEIGRRSVETQSMVRLTHIGVFSDPIVFFQLRVLGKELYLYCIRDRNSRSTQRPPTLSDETQGESVGSNMSSAFLSPVRLPRSGNDVADFDTNSRDEMGVEYELVACVNSATVPWSLLVDCG
jgi:hypothetical protein